MTAHSEIFETYRPLLFSIAYRMLGSVMEAEDMVQETYLRYENAASDEIQFPKAYLSAIITRLCLDHLKSARVQRENYVGTWLPEPLLTGDATAAIVGDLESISMAFLVLLESLSPIERAIFLLRDVFDYRYAEIAGMVGKSEVNCRRYYHLAKKSLIERRPRFESSLDQQKALIQGFLQAVTSGDIDNLTSMLTDEVTLYGDGGGKVPAVRQPLVGHEAVIRLLLGSYRLAPPDMTIKIAEVNGRAAILSMQQDQVWWVMNFAITDNKITTIFNILNPDKIAHLLQHDPPATPRKATKPAD